jgi:outer membrane protein assembly factor BamE
MRKLLLTFPLILLLAGCSYFHIYKKDIAQGNVITPAMMDQIHKGMTPAQVTNVMGNPVLANMFDKDHLHYVYTFKPGYGPGEEKMATFIFTRGRLSEIQGNMYSQYVR